MTGTSEITLHLGAHRTGTTALQQYLQRAAAPLAAGGMVFWGPVSTREEPLSSALRAAIGGRAPEKGRATLAAAIAGEAALGRGRVLLSDENLLGSIGANLDAATLYPEAGTRLARLAAALPAAPRRIFVTVRDFAEYWRSAYAFRYLATGEASLDTEALARSPGTSWLPLLDAVRRAFPASCLIVARYRAVRTFVPALAVAMVGEAALAGVARPPVHVNRSLPAATLAELSALSDKDERTRRARAARSQGGAPADPFAPELAADLQARFRKEWVAIRGGAVPGAEIFRTRAKEAVE